MSSEQLLVNLFGSHADGVGDRDGQSEADVNGDGVVNVFDLVFVANQF